MFHELDQNVLKQCNFLRDIDWRKITMRGIVKVVAPLVKDESKRLVQSRGQHHRFGQPMQEWLGFGEGWGGRGGGRAGGKGGGRGNSLYANMAWSKDGARPISCHKCGGLGHYANQCPLGGEQGLTSGAEGQKKSAGAVGTTGAT